MMEYTPRPEAKPFRIPCLAGSKLAIILLLTSAKKLLTKFAHNEQIYCEQKFAR
jgi:hypothetical protein